MADVVSGHIDSAEMSEAFTKMKELVDRYNEIKDGVENTNISLMDNWVGDGKDMYESQYALIVSKINDFGDIFTEMYNALVDATADYQDGDDKIRQDYVKAVSA